MVSSYTTEHRAVRVISVTGLSSVLSIGMQLVTVPICLKYWGRDSYGIWLALFSVFSMLQSTGSGFVNYVGNRINLLYHQDQAALQETLASSLAGIFLLAGVQLVLVLIILGFGALPGLLGATNTALAAQNANWALVVLTVSWILGGFYLGIIHRLLIPAGMMYQAAWWALGSQSGLFLVVIGSAAFQFSLLQTSVAFAVVQFLFAFGSASYIRFSLPRYYPWWHGFHPAQGLRDLWHSIPLSVSGLIQQGAGSGLVILVSAIAGAAAVPAFATVRTLTNLWTTATNVLTTPLLPDVVRFHAKSEGRKLLAVHEAHGVIVGAMINMSILLAYPFIGPVYNYWTNHTIVLDRILLCTLLASASLMNLGAMMNAFLTGINHRRSILSSTMARGGVSLVIGGLMLAYIGVGGIGLGVWAGEFSALAFLAYFFIKTTRMHPETDLTPRTLAPVFLGVVSVQSYLGAEAMGVPSAPLLYPAAICGVVVGVIWGWCRMDSEVRSRLVRLVSGQRDAKEDK